MAKRGLYYNGSGYPDPTAYEALKPIVRADSELEKRAHDLINVLKTIAEWAGFEFIGRVQLRHKRTKREFK